MVNQPRIKQLVSYCKLNLTGAAILALTVATAACTTNRNPGSGTPATSGAALRTAPTAGISGAIETPQLPPPMFSSYRTSQSQTPPRRLAPADAAAVMAQLQPRVRVLGPSNPARGVTSSGGAEVTTRRDDLNLSPVSTVNTSINASRRVSGITSAGDAGSIVVGAGVTGSAIVAPATVTGTSLTPTMASASLPSLAGLSAAATSPVALSASLPPVTTLSSRSGTTADTAAPARITRRPSTASASPVRVMNSSGRVVITNLGDKSQ